MLWLATATHNFKYVKIGHICSIWDNIRKSWCLSTYFSPYISDLITR